MIRILLEALLQVGIIIPIAVFILNDKSWANYRRLLIFVFVFLCYEVALRLPGFFDIFDFINSTRWNWDGKILGILWGIISYLIFKKHFSKYDFFTLKQYKEGFKQALIGSILIVILASVIWFILGESDFNIETLAFNITLPGIDEEIMFRGILLGLLMSSLKSKIRFIGNPSILLTAILFGFIHALKLNKDYEISFNILYFIQTGFAGYVWGWITIKSRSILLPILSHNFSNFFGTLVTMIK